MSSALEAFQAQCRTLGGTAGTVNEDFHGAANAAGISPGQWAERILAYAQLVDSTIPTAAAAFNFFLEDPTRLSLSSTFYYLLENGVDRYIMEDGVSFYLTESAP